LIRRVRFEPPWLIVGLGLLLIGAAQALSPVAAPLYDGLIVLGPYHYLNPAAGQTGSPTSATVSEGVVGGQSPGFNAATGETPPQAQLIAAPGAFVLGPGSTSVTVTIDPVAPAGPSTVGPILGNAYRFAVRDQAGVALGTQPGIDFTLVMRAPDAISEASFATYANGTWRLVDSSPSGTPAFFIATTSLSGDYALVASGSGFGFVQAGALTVVVTIVLLAAGFVLIRRRRRAQANLALSAARPRPPSGGAARPPSGQASRRKRKRR
jgi:hypothetical protein